MENAKRGFADASVAKNEPTRSCAKNVAEQVITKRQLARKPSGQEQVFTRLLGQRLIESATQAIRALAPQDVIRVTGLHSARTAHAFPFIAARTAPT